MKAILSSVFFIGPLISTPLALSAEAWAAADTAGAGAQGNRPPARACASTTQQPADDGWPRAYVTSSGARLVIDEPQIASWLEQKRTAMYAAVSCKPFIFFQRPLPASFRRRPHDDHWKAVKASLGAQHAGTAAAAPTVLVSQNPAELMLLNGVAAYTPVRGTRLERVSNTDSNVFRVATAGTVYSLVPGRWFADTHGGTEAGPYSGAGYAAWYNPRTGSSARGAAAWGPGRGRGATHA
jgi:hypothetical protein